MGFQIVPLAMLGAYLLYASYYYATPMFFLKVMLFLAHIRHRDIDIRFEERRIIARFSKGGEEHIVVRAVDEELESRFWPMTACLRSSISFSLALDSASITSYLRLISRA